MCNHYNEKKEKAFTPLDAMWSLQQKEHGSYSLCYIKRAKTAKLQVRVSFLLT